MISKEKNVRVLPHKIEAIVFISLKVVSNVRKKMFTNSLLFVAWDVFF